MKKVSSLLLFLLSTLTSFATNYYVTTSNGKDTNNGTEAQPWKTITKAANTIDAGDTDFYQNWNLS